MKTIRPRTRRQNHLPARSSPKLRRKRRSLDTELLQGLYRNQAAGASQRTKSLGGPASRLAGLRAEGNAKVRGNSVHREVVAVRSLTGNTELSLPTYHSRGSWRDHHARRQFQ